MRAEINVTVCCHFTVVLAYSSKLIPRSSLTNNLEVMLIKGCRTTPQILSQECQFDVQKSSTLSG